MPQANSCHAMKALPTTIARSAAAFLVSRLCLAAACAFCLEFSSDIGAAETPMGADGNGAFATAA
jgi:hypothetical protein